jgi:hypothetical protein
VGGVGGMSFACQMNMLLLSTRSAGKEPQHVISCG